METPPETENQTYRSQLTSQPTFGSKLIAQEPPSNQLVTQRYNLRSREDLNVPASCLDNQKQKNNEAIGKLKKRVSGEKSIITMKINQMNKLIGERAQN